MVSLKVPKDSKRVAILDAYFLILKEKKGEECWVRSAMERELEEFVKEREEDVNAEEYKIVLRINK